MRCILNLYSVIPDLPCEPLEFLCLFYHDSDGGVVVEYPPQPLGRHSDSLFLFLTAEWLWSTLRNHLSGILAALLHF